MNVQPYIKHVPAIEQTIRENELDAIVCGMGPTAWLLPWMDQSLIGGLRLFGVHDAFRIMAMDDLILMDRPMHALHPENFRGAAILASRPKRIWVYDKPFDHWKQTLPPAVHPIMKPVPWGVWQSGNVNPRDVYATKFKLADSVPHTTSISPTGTTTLAWREGCRRIGVLGVDLMKGHHHMFQVWPIVDAFFMRMATQAQEAGGCVVNLSPITSLKKFHAWKPSTSGSAPINGNAQPEPNSSSNTASASMQPAPSTSTG